MYTKRSSVSRSHIQEPLNTDREDSNQVRSESVDNGGERGVPVRNNTNKHKTEQPPETESCEGAVWFVWFGFCGQQPLCCWQSGSTASSPHVQILLFFTQRTINESALRPFSAIFEHGYGILLLNTRKDILLCIHNLIMVSNRYGILMTVTVLAKKDLRLGG